jgi:hypothetical protein
MKFWKRYCQLCDTNKIPYFGATKIKLQCTDGVSTLRICGDCAVTLEGLRLLKNGYEMKDDTKAT